MKISKTVGPNMNILKQSIVEPLSNYLFNAILAKGKTTKTMAQFRNTTSI